MTLEKAVSLAHKQWKLNVNEWRRNKIKNGGDKGKVV